MILKGKFQIAFHRRMFQSGDSEQGCCANCLARMVTPVLCVLAVLHPFGMCLAPLKPSKDTPCSSLKDPSLATWTI